MSQWISVKQNLPAFGIFLCCDQDQWICIAMFNSMSKGEWLNQDTGQQVLPSHYMPLPSPPKE